MTPQRWIAATNAIDIISKSGRYGGTFAHKDIAIEFATWLNTPFKFYLIKEYQRLKVLSNMECINAVLIRQGLTQSERLVQLNKVAIAQMTSLMKSKSMNSIKKLNQ